MKTIHTIMRCALVVMIVATVADAQTRKAGLTGASFLKIGVGAREVALGTAVTALPGDANGMFYNPASIALKDEVGQATFNYNKWIADLGHTSAAITYNWEGVGTFGVGFITFGVSDITADRDIYSDPILAAQQTDHNTSATYDYRDMSVQLTYSRYVMDNFSLGATVKGIFETADGTTINAIAVDFGSVYNIGLLDWRIAARLNNLGSDMKYYDIAFGLPLTFTIGTSIVPINTEIGKLTLAVDAVKSQDGPQYFFTGGEFSFNNMLFLRGGYKLNYSGTDDGGTTTRKAIKNTLEGLSLGAGFRVGYEGILVTVDYAYTKMQLLDNVHRFSVTLGLK
jgi:hypothetical protein